MKANSNKLVLYLVVLITSLSASFNDDIRIYLFLVNYVILLPAFLFSNIMNIKIQVLLFIIALLVSSIFNISEIHMYISNFYVIIATYLLIQNIDKDETFRIVLYGIMSYLVIIFLMMLFSKPEMDLGEKHFLSITIPRRRYDFVQYSQLAFLVGYTFYLLSFLKNKIIKFSFKVLLLFIPLLIGKMSILLSIIVIFILSFFYKLFKVKTIRFSALVLFFSTSFVGTTLFTIFKDDKSLLKLFSGRPILWNDFVTYILKSDFINLFFGNGFFSEAKGVSYLTHPHNQYLSALYIGGIVLFISYFFLLKKIFDSSYNNIVTFQLFFFLLLIQITDDYFVLTALPIVYILLFNLLKKDFISEDALDNEKVKVNNIKQL